MKKTLIGAAFFFILMSGVASAQVYGTTYGSYGSFQQVQPSYNYGYQNGYQNQTYGSCPQFGTFTIGMRGAQVIALQQFLAVYYPGQLITGYFGPQTQGNWQNFQILHGCSTYSYNNPGYSYPGYPYSGYPNYYDNNNYYDGSIRLTSLSDDTLNDGDRVTLEWDVNHEPSDALVRLDLYRNGYRLGTITTVDASDNDYRWKVPRVPTDDTYSIRATLLARNGYEIDSDESDEFEINH
ncbi:hypothetical protein KW798_02705 [Candidatus Parcubacteria bacterium]|nr:hypothetical protein [Candidatus Parcubacteria bacterium]